MNIQEVIDTISTKGGIDQNAAEQVAGTILSVIQQEVDPSVSTALFQKLPGATELASANAVSASSGGFLSSITTSVLGNKAGVLAAGLTRLESSGLSMVQIESAASNILTYIKANAGSELAKQVAASVPALGAKMG